METIVVGVDGSEASDRALHWAAAEARVRDARLRVVHAWFEVFVDGLFAAPAACERDAVEDMAHECLEKAVASIPAGSPDVRVEPVLVHGLPETVLTREADEADLVVVGSRGRGGITEMMLGSVSHYVLHHARCPIVVVH